MNLNTRRFIALFFVLAFFIATPILILYTAGYRYSWKKQKISKAGSLVLETEPKGADVYLNNEKITDLTPIRLTDVFPNDYQIRIEKDGYYSWEKNLTVVSQETTFAEDIILFKKSEAQQVNQDTIENYWLLKENNNILYQTQHNENTVFYLFDTEDEKATEIFSLPAEQTAIEKVQINNQENKLIVNVENEQQEQTWLIDLQNPQNNINLTEAWPQIDLDNLTWDFQDDQKLYFIDKNNELMSFNFEQPLTDAQSQLQFDENEEIIDFAIYSDTAYFLKKQNNNVYLTKKSLGENNNTTPQPQIQLDYANYAIVDFIDNKLLIQNQQNNKLHIINLELDNVLLTQNDIIDYTFNNDEKQLLMLSETDIQIANFNTYPFNLQTITRVSQSLTDSNWLVPNYIYYLQNNQIILAELDERDTRNQITLPMQNVVFTMKNENADWLYFYSTDTDGLQKIEITD